MKRGEIWTVSGGSDYTGKPRPAVILQNDVFSGSQSVIVCAFTTTEVDAPLLRLQIEPSEANGLQRSCSIMADKPSTVPRVRLGAKIGVLSQPDMQRLNRAVIVILGLA